MSWVYTVVPFEAKASKGMSFQAAAANQFAALLKEMNDNGYEYYRMDSYNVRESPGCWGKFFSKKDIVVTYNVAVFRQAA